MEKRPRFKVGDKVRVVPYKIFKEVYAWSFGGAISQDHYEWVIEDAGANLTVKEVKSSFSIHTKTERYTVRFCSGTGHTTQLWEDYLEHDCRNY